MRFLCHMGQVSPPFSPIMPPSWLCDFQCVARLQYCPAHYRVPYKIWTARLLFPPFCWTYYVVYEWTNLPSSTTMTSHPFIRSIMYDPVIEGRLVRSPMQSQGAPGHKRQVKHVSGTLGGCEMWEWDSGWGARCGRRVAADVEGMAMSGAAVGVEGNGDVWWCSWC